MPTYTFQDTETGEVFDKILKISEKDNFLKDNPNLKSLVTGINIVAGVGRVKGDSGWKENLSRIAEAHPRSALADRHGNKSIKDIKTKQVVEKHMNKRKK
jgi:predicted nucleic acid-binding Zn ribbon protein